MSEVLEIAPSPAPQGLSVAELTAIEAACLRLPQVDCPLEHRFAPGVYLRKITMPKGTFVIGHQHRTEHFNVILRGRATVIMDGQVHEVVAPCILKSGAGMRKALYIWEEMEWATIHPTDETDVSRLEEALVIKSDAFIRKTIEDAEMLRTKLIEEGRI